MKDMKKLVRDFWYGKPAEETRMADLYIQPTGLYKHREWRGVKDTFYYMYMIWGYNYVNMVMDIVKYGNPIDFVKGLWRYRWMGQTYIPVLHWFDRGLEGLRGPALRASAWHYRAMVSSSIRQMCTMFNADTVLHGGKKNDHYYHTLAIKETFWGGIFYGWSDKFIAQPLEMIPYFVTCHVNSHVVLNYIDAAQSIGLPGDPCPMCQAEEGLFVLDDVPDYSPLFFTVNEACDGSVGSTILQDWFFDKPLFALPMTMQFDNEEVMKNTMNEIEQCWAFMEEQTGVPMSTSRTCCRSSSGRSGTSLRTPTLTRSAALRRLCTASIRRSTAPGAPMISGIRWTRRFVQSWKRPLRRRSTPSRRPVTESSPGPARRCTTPTGALGPTTPGA